MCFYGREKMQPQQNTDDSPKYPSLDFAFNIIKEFITAQLQGVDALDTKANFAIGAATGVLSAALIFQPSLFTLHNHSSCSAIIPGFIHALPLLLRKALPLLILLCIYLFVMILFFAAYKIRDFQQVPEPKHFLQNLHLTVQDAQESMIAAMVAAHEHNKKESEKKARAINTALMGVGAETLVLGLLLLYQVAC
jgi:hypothetical protein